MKHRRIFISFAAFPVLLAMAPWSLNYGQTQQPPTVSAEPSAEHRPGGAVGDPIRQLNLTPEQREQIRSIRQETTSERAAINQRVREANRALETALDSDNPDETAVEQKMRDLAAAQADAMRMRISTEVKIRRVLTVEQRTTLRSLRQQARERQHERLEMRDQRQRRRAERSNRRDHRNDPGPVFPGRDGQRRPPL